MISSVFPHGQIPGSLELAFVGDSIYDLAVRRVLVMKGGKVNEQNRRAAGIVNAHAQSEALKRIEPLLSEEELMTVRRAKNTHQSPTGHADPVEYRNATALEALLGYLYLTNQLERLNELIKLATGLEEACV